MNWRVQVLGRLALSQGDRIITHFESNRVAALLAYLALFPHRPHPREELIELLWPEIEPEIGRQRFRQALSSLRRQLEPPGIPHGSILIATRQEVQFNPETFTCDALEFERCVRQRRYAEAKALYVGELLPGFYDDWALQERYRLEELAERLPDAAPEETSADALRIVPERPARETPSLIALPAYLTPCIGREEERQRLAEFLRSHRLVTITGTGGGGKTRIATEVARQIAPDYERVAFVSLAECVAPGQIPEQLRVALQLPASTVSALEQAFHVLSNSKTLLVLDNFEQLVEEGGSVFAATLLERLPNVTCLVTSRRLLGIPGEQEFPLAPLPLPQEDAPLLETARCPSVALFLNRAQAVRPGFQINERNQAELIALCRALEGLPLVLELAATRLRALSPAEMRTQIENRFQWLVRSGPGADKEPRHRSLLATLEWSWRLLSPAQQRFFASLSVFRGGWTAAMAATVCATEDARERLEALTMDSLVVSEEATDGSTRFRMLETVRAFAKERLPLEESLALRRRHRLAALALAQGDVNGETLALETGNLVAALESACEDSESDIAFALCLALEERWMPLVGAETALALARNALATQGGDNALRVRTLDYAARLALLTAELTAAWELSEQALQRAGDVPALRAQALIALARTRLDATVTSESLAEIEGWTREALALAREAQESRLEGIALRLLGRTTRRLGNVSEAEACMRQSLARLEAVGDAQNAIVTLDNLANVAVEVEDLDGALELYARCQERAEAIGDFVYLAKVYQNLAAIYARQGRWAESIAAGQECLRRNQALGNEYILSYALWNLPEPLAYSGQEAMAAQLMPFAERFWTTRYGALKEEDFVYREQVRARILEALSPEQTAALWERGGRLSLQQALALALSV